MSAERPVTVIKTNEHGQLPYNPERRGYEPIAGALMTARILTEDDNGNPRIMNVVCENPIYHHDGEKYDDFQDEEPGVYVNYGYAVNK